MIVAGLVLLAVGALDAVRAFVRTRTRIWIGFAGIALVVAALGALAADPIALLIAWAAGGLWVVLMPQRGGGRAGAWPVLGIALVCAVAVMAGGEGGGPLAALGPLSSPIGPLSPARVILLLGAVCFLFESGNVVVRAALVLERARGLPRENEGTDEVRSHVPPPPAARASALKGGRLIGPLERLLVFALTLTGAYTLLAAVIAAKGIVRFPEISRDGENGDRAEYFLVGSMVSWVMALAAAFLVWWSFGSIPG